jgi:hypothetical protein
MVRERLGLEYRRAVDAGRDNGRENNQCGKNGALIENLKIKNSVFEPALQRRID